LIATLVGVVAMSLMGGASLSSAIGSTGPKVPVRAEDVPEGRGRPTGAVDPSQQEARLKMKEVG
jgi:hypothetical protein